jgi:hypothetical protein
MRNKMLKYCLIVSAFVITSESSSFALASCDRLIASAERKVSSTEKTCERGQDRVVLLENTKADALERLRSREELANSYNPTDSVSCFLAEAFGECDARRRRRRFVENLNRTEATYNRRIKAQQDKANRDCAKFGAASQKLADVQASCTPV